MVEDTISFESNLGIVAAKELIWEGKIMKASEALEKKLIDAVAEIHWTQRLSTRCKPG